MKIKFICPTCGSPAANEFSQLKDFNITAYGEDVIEWSENENKIPPLNENKFWLRSEQSPEVGNSRVINVSHLFCEKIGSEFWTLYQPALSSLNGWDEHPDEIDISAFIRCKVVKVLMQQESYAWLIVEVTDRIFLHEVEERVQLVKERSPIVENTYQFDCFDYQELNGWHYFSGNAQGDLGNWMLINEIDNNLRLIAFGEWGTHYQSAYLGNISISKHTFKTLLEWSENA